MSEDDRADRAGAPDRAGGPPRDGPAREFVRRAVFDGDALLGARWWNESFVAFHAGALGRRGFVGLLPKLAAATAGAFVVGAIAHECTDDDGLPSSLDALDLQRREGWNAGQPGRSVPFPHLVLDADGGTGWLDDLGGLATALAPEPRLRPYAVPTLFQALSEPLNNSLRAVVRPVHAPGADEAFARGEALRALCQQHDAPDDLALVVDLPGPQSVAFAAALAPRFCPVFTFDNWPHPLGVVPAHLTLGACLYYRPRFQAAARARPQPSPPLFVLDANRLAPYRDAADQFDNRYMAPLPAAGALATLGVKRILYVRPDAASLTELDDLNADFVAWQREGIAVRALPLTDFSTAITGDAPPAGPDAGAGVASAAAATGRPQAAAGVPPTAHYYYGGHWFHQPLFWRSYGFAAGPAPTRRPPRVAPPPARLSNAAAYRPQFRPTLFATSAVGGLAGVGKQKPSGFGRVSFRSGGGLFGSGSRSSRRSGSFGRSRSSSWG
jgi:hypothetical protein